jgi:hypothetical protein
VSRGKFLRTAGTFNVTTRYFEITYLEQILPMMTG